MHYSDLERTIAEESIAFPITEERLIRRLGDVELTPPIGDSVALSEVLRRAGEPIYQSPEMLYRTVTGNLDESFVGRKYYDDRSGCLTRTDSRRPTQRSL